MDNKRLEKGYLMNIMFAVIMMIAMLFFITSNSVFSSVGLGEYVKLGKYITKGSASILFVLFGLLNLLFVNKSGNMKNTKFLVFMLVGLVFAMLGDILLIDFFVIGAALFAVGHVFFFVAFCFMARFKVRDIICVIAILIPAMLLIFLYPNFEFGGMLPVVIAYAVIISAMLGKAISNVFEKENKLLNVVIMIGALMFFLSDLMLLFNVFGSAPYVFDVACIALYYPAEYLLAFSMFLVGAKFEKKALNQAQQ
ncbi:MAG: lysoplasmalogenase [Clostridia bacterium]|nr:lysoplasmalogenase [Clostridia bacterium]